MVQVAGHILDKKNNSFFLEHGTFWLLKIGRADGRGGLAAVRGTLEHVRHPSRKKRGRCSRSRPISNNWNQACSSHSKPDMSWNDPAAGYFLFLLRSHSLLTLTAIHFVFVWGTKMARSRRIWWNWPNGGLPLADFRGPFYWRIFFCESQSAKLELAIIQKFKSVCSIKN